MAVHTREDIKMLGNIKDLEGHSICDVEPCWIELWSEWVKNIYLDIHEGSDCLRGRTGLAAEGSMSDDASWHFSIEKACSVG
jgi:hypothetical protein